MAQIPRTVSFEYFHPLCVPRIHPLPHKVAKGQPHGISAKHILRFGFIDGDAVVHGERVVYDPQSPNTPSLFAANGSTAKELVITANAREATLFAEGTDISSIGRAIREKAHATAVIVKLGSQGSLVISESGEFPVPAYKTESVWPIGSGDVFAAAVAHFWAELSKNIVEAANLASLAAASYCNSRALPIRKDVFGSHPELEPVNVTSDKGVPQVYLAGPFFTMAQRWLISEAKISLESQGLRVFSPYHDVGPGDAADVVPADVAGIEKSQVVFAVVDGLDSGTLFEIGYARSRKIPVVVFVQNENEEDLKMLEGTNCAIVHDFSSAVYRAAWAADS